MVYEAAHWGREADKQERTGPSTPATLGDLRYRALMGQKAWEALAPDVRRRFSHRLAAGESLVYSGQIVETHLSRLGRLLVTAARLIGGPFPLRAYGAGEPTVVTVTEDKASQGQFWTRLYGWGRGFPQIVHSSKRFAGPTGLEEYVGCGIGVALTLHEEAGALVFRSAGYFLSILGRRLRLPAWLSPGDLRVCHRDLGDGRFVFGLTLDHPRFGCLLSQTALFRDQEAATNPADRAEETRALYSRYGSPESCGSAQ